MELPAKHRRQHRWLAAAYVIVWLTVLGFATYGTIRYARQTAVHIAPDQLYGVQLRDAATGHSASNQSIVQFTLGEEANKAGVQAGDHIVSVNGNNVGADQPASKLFAQIAAGAPATILLAPANAPQRLVTLHKTTMNAEQGFARSGISLEGRALMRVIIFIGTFYLAPVVLAFLLLAYRQRAQLASWLSLALVLNALGSGPSLYVDAAKSGFDALLTIAVNLACPIAGWAQIAVLALFPEASRRILLPWLIVVGTLPLMRWMQVDSSVLETNTSLLLGQGASVLVIWLRYRRMPSGVGKQQIKWALFGFAASLVCQAAVIIIQRTFFYTDSPSVYVYLNLLADLMAGLSLLLLFGAMTLGLLQYRLYDADAAISRSVAYGALTLGILGIFAGTERMIELLGEHYFGGSLGALAGGLGAAVAAAMIVPLHQSVSRWAEKRFRSRLAHLRHGLPLLAGDLRETSGLNAMAETVLARIDAGIHVQRAAICVSDQAVAAINVTAEHEQSMHAAFAHAAKTEAKIVCVKSDQAFPLRICLSADGVGNVGWLLLGPRPDGSFFSREEKATLLEIADPLARALSIVAKREDRERRISVELSDLRSSVRQLQNGMRRGSRGRVTAIPVGGAPAC